MTTWNKDRSPQSSGYLQQLPGTHPGVPERQGYFFQTSYPVAPPQTSETYQYNITSEPAENTPFSNRAGVYGTPHADQDAKDMTFSDQIIRRGFIRKVYSILCVQLCVTLTFIAWFFYHIPTKRFVQVHPSLWIISFVVMFVTLIALVCCGEVRRKWPTNFMLLALFTLAESFMLGCITSNFNSQEVLLAVGITAVVCLALTLFAFQTKYDFTILSGFLFVAIIILILFGIFAIIFHNKILTLVYASVGALIFCFYLVYDTQLMMSGKHKYSLSPEEYIFATLSLYLDITRIFMFILTIIGSSRN